MKRMIILFMVCAATSIMAQSNYVFEVDFDTDEVKASYGPVTTNTAPMVELLTISKKIKGYRYMVFVTKAQEKAGWAALPQAVKDAAKDYASEWYDDYEGWDGKARAMVDALLDELNEIRTDHKLGLPPITKNQMKQKIKDKKPKMKQKIKDKKPKKK